MEDNNNNKNPKEISLEMSHAIFDLPTEAVEINMAIKVFHDGEIVSVSGKYSITDIREAFRKAEDGYIDADDKLTLTDLGLQYLEEVAGRNEV